MVVCPACGSTKVWKNGKRPNKGKLTQRYLCANGKCGRQFYEPETKKKAPATK